MCQEVDVRLEIAPAFVRESDVSLQGRIHMRRFRWLVLLSMSMFAIAAACNQAAAPPPPASESPLRPTATIKDIMDSLVDPSADVLWESVATIVTAKGTDERRPRTDEEWANVRRNAVRLLEATNLLVMEGRHVAKPGEKSENPGIELEPEQMEKLMTEDRASFLELAHGLYDAALPALKAIDAKNAEGLLDAGEGIDTACENCHLKYWYPLQEQAQKAKEGAASPRKQ